MFASYGTEHCIECSGWSDASEVKEVSGVPPWLWESIQLLSQSEAVDSDPLLLYRGLPPGLLDPRFTDASEQ